MAIFKCKMCGGTLEINGNETVATCEYCGTQQTLPRLDDEKKANLYDRANHFRRGNDFDKAAAIYEQILNEDATDAEAYWSLVLCRYGIEYVEDPATHKRIPTVNRAQFTSIFADEDYKSALQHADGYQKSIYEEEAKAIDEIQKGILAISQKEEPFDIFICYKETDNNGRRTPDSVLANDLYHQLTQEGFKVFFSRITLEDKLGTAYEPYIFAALNSAKVMVVLGTKPEYFNAVWVKNEWSRYLALIRKGAKKTLIPAYKDMDPYDLPEEFSHLQAQDMSKLGFMQDLIRGIRKIAQTETAGREETSEPAAAADPGTDPLLRRAFMFLEDGNWKEADEYCEKVLDRNPEEARAYVGKLMAELHVKKQEDLLNCKPFDAKNNYQKAVRFADDALKATLVEYNNQIYYAKAKAAMESARSETTYREAAEMFEKLGDYSDAAVLAAECTDKAETLRKNGIYTLAKSLMARETIKDCDLAIRNFKIITGWKDADEQIVLCQKKIEEIRANAEAKRIEQQRQAEISRQRAEKVQEEEKKRLAKRKKIITLIAVIAAAVICACVIIVLVINNVIIPMSKYDGAYNAAVDLMKSGQYEDAISAFEAMDGYKDSKDKIEECEVLIQEDEYNEAIAQIDKGDIINAYESLVALNGYKDSTAKANEIYEKYKIEKIKSADVGGIVCFGSYEQDNDTTNGEEDIEWLVLAKEDNKALVISKYALDCQAYDLSSETTTWENCGLRTWLNNTFLNNAFSDEEQEKIATTDVGADNNPLYNTDPGNATKDKVFLLSIPEEEKYFSTEHSGACEPTAYAIANGVYVYDNGNSFFWLRSPGESQDLAAVVNILGSVDYSGFKIVNWIFAVRPAMWINLE